METTDSADAPARVIPAEIHSSCPLCGAKPLQLLYIVGQFPIARCPGCGLVLVQSKFTPETLDPYYRVQGNDYIYDDPANRANLDYYYRRLISLMERWVKGGRLLDVGCCAGQFLEGLGSHWSGHGVELAPHYYEQARALFGDRIIRGDLHDLDTPSEPFDAVTMMDVLDHSPDPIKDLQRVHELLRPGGVIAVKVHNISCLWAKWAGKDFYAIIPPYHLFYFNRHTLSLALDRAGFDTVAVRFIGHRLFLKTVPFRLSKGDTNSVFYRLYQRLDRSAIGQLPIYKNLFDIVTIIGVRR